MSPFAGIPYAWTDPQTGARTCPACGLIVPEDYDAEGEPLSMNYAEHFTNMHDSPARRAAGPHGLAERAQAEAGQGLALVLTAEPGSVLYRVPDGRDDKPTPAGQHTKTTNVMHSALEYARFRGCEHCRAMAASEARCHNRGFHGHYSDTWAGEHPGTPNAHYAADCPDGYRPPNWEPGTIVCGEPTTLGRCTCETCQRRRAVLGF